MNNIKKTEQEYEDMLLNPTFHFMKWIEAVEKGENNPELDPKRYDADYDRVFKNYPKDGILRQIFYGFVGGFDAAMNLSLEIIKSSDNTATTTETTK